MANGGLAATVMMAVTRIQPTFTKGTTEIDGGISTAFWLGTTKGPMLLVTARHALDPRLAVDAFPSLSSEIPDPENWRTEQLAIELRQGDSVDAPVRWFTVEQPRLHYSSNDCALVVEPFDSPPKDGFAHRGPVHIYEDALASEQHLTDELAFLDQVFFVGFPFNWWDQARHLPIARLAHMATPGWAIDRRTLPTDDGCLVTGLSFGGSSGSPVIAYPKPVAEGSFEGVLHPPLVVGVMSGHIVFREPKTQQHSGLSYFTRSTSIRALIDEAVDSD